MLRITVELVPHGDEAAKRTLGTMEVANDGSGYGTLGNYKLRFINKRGARGAWAAGASSFPRRSLGIWDLLLRTLIITHGGRNKRIADAARDALHDAPDAL